MDGEPAAAAQTERIAERDNIDTAAIAAGADHLARGYSNSRCWKADAQMLKVYGSGGRLRRGSEAGEALLSRLDHTTRADTDKVRCEEASGFLRGLCMEPLVFHAQNGLSYGWSFGLRLCLRGRAQERDREQQNGDDRWQPQILMKIFLRYSGSTMSQQSSM
jgi:hypothetical protein